MNPLNKKVLTEDQKKALKKAMADKKKALDNDKIILK
jgi:hypothetical protein